MPKTQSIILPFVGNIIEVLELSGYILRKRLVFLSLKKPIATFFIHTCTGKIVLVVVLDLALQVLYKTKQQCEMT